MRPTKPTRWWTTAICAVLFLHTPANAKPGDGYQLLEPLPGDDASFASGLSVTGMAVGASLSSSSPRFGQGLTAVLWEGPGEPARVLPPLPGDPESFASGINALGQVAGESGEDIAFVGGTSRAVVWEPDETITVLPLPPGAVYSSAGDINARGQVVGHSFGGVPDQALRWEPDGSITVLQPPVPGAGRLHARRINDRGQVIGTYSNGNRPAFWDAAGTGYPLETLPSHPRGFTTGINARSEVCGAVTDGAGGTLGVVWDRDRIRRILDPLPGDVWSAAAGISDAGVVVGLSVSADDDRTPVKWADRSSEAVSLGLPAAGLARGWAVRVNARGQMIVWAFDDTPPTVLLSFLLE